MINHIILQLRTGSSVLPHLLFTKRCRLAGQKTGCFAAHFHECQHQQMALPAPSAHFRISAAGRFVQKKLFLFIELAAEIHATRPDIQFTLGGDEIR